MIEISSKLDLQAKLSNPGKIVVCFCASWCPFCDRFKPVFDKFASRSDFAVFIRVFVDEYSNPLWEDYDLEAVPTLILFENRRVMHRLDGGLGSGISEGEFSEWLKEG